MYSSNATGEVVILLSHLTEVRTRKTFCSWKIECLSLSLPLIPPTLYEQSCAFLYLRAVGSLTSWFAERWSKDFLEAGKKRLAGDVAREATSDEVRGLRREAAALKEVVADLTLENRLLKK
ncbi:hypothetical protein DES45_1313, partial [Microvirga subterranea]